MGAIANWRVILIVLALAVLGGSGYLFLKGEDVYRPDGLLTVDVYTGDLYEFKLNGRAAFIWPERHPETKEPSLLKVSQQEDGTWRIHERAMADLDEMKSQDQQGRIVVDSSGVFVPTSEVPVMKLRSGQVLAN